MKKINFKSLLFHTLIPLMIGFIISMLIGDTEEYYELIRKPVDIPRIVFPIVWTILYILMGFAAYIVDNNETLTSPKAMRLYYLQLIVNFSWQFVFFGLKMIGLAVIVTFVLFLLVLFTTIQFYKEKRIAGILFIPYLLWVTFALYLTFGIYFLNM